MNVPSRTISAATPVTETDLTRWASGLNMPVPYLRILPGCDLPIPRQPNKWRNRCHGLSTKSAVIIMILFAALLLILAFACIILRCSRRRRRHQGFHQGKARRHTPNFELQPAKTGVIRRLSPVAYDGAGSDIQTALDRESVEAFRQGTNGAAASRRSTNARPDDMDNAETETSTMPTGSLQARPFTALEKGKGKMYPQPDSHYHPGFDGASDAQLVEELNNAIAADAALEQASQNNTGLSSSDQDLSADDSVTPQGQLHHLATANKHPSHGARHFSFITKAPDERLDVIAPAPPVMANARQRLSSGYEAEDESLDTATLGDGSGSISTGSRISSTSSVSRRGWRHADEELHVPMGRLSQTSLRGGHVAPPRAEITPMGKFGQTGQKWRSGVVSWTRPEAGKEPGHGVPAAQRLRKKKGSVGEMARPLASGYDGAAACREEDGAGELSVPRKRPFSEQRGSREGDQIHDGGARGKWVENEFGEHFWVEDEIAMRRWKGLRGSSDSGYVTGREGEGEEEGEGEGDWQDAREVFTLDDLPSAQFKGGSLRGKGE